MKRYKLLKDLPTFKAGDEFYLDSANDLRFKGSDITVYNDKTLEKFPNILKDWFEEIPEYKRWRAEEDEAYYAINRSGFVYRVRDTRQPEDDYRYKTGSYGRTAEELEAKREYDIARQVLLDDADGGKFVRAEIVYYADYNSSIIVNKWNVNYTLNSYSPGKIYFKDKKSLKKSLKIHEKQWEIVRKYETGEL
jgi:hypothetical protein|nr:MAG TPA: hypothetical protein [Caudoviricetes sp.]